MALVPRPPAEAAQLQASLDSRAIRRLFHATFSASLSAIDHTHGLAAEAVRTPVPYVLPASGTHISSLAAAFSRHVCLSVRPFWGLIAQMTHASADSVCLLELDPGVILHRGTAFSATYTTDLHLARRELLRTSPADFDALFEGPTSSTPVINAAKVLIPDGVPSAFIKRVVFATDAERSRAVEVHPQLVAPSVVEPAQFPEVARNTKAKSAWPASAEAVRSFWGDYFGLMR